MKSIAVILLISLVSLTPTYAMASKDHRGAKYHQIKTLPKVHHHIVHRGKDYYFSGGRFYRQNRGVYVSINAPLGAVVPILPNGHITFGVGSARYFYHAGIYYRRSNGGYVVIKEPKSAEASLSGGSDKLIIYPAEGQSDAQKKQDKFECHEWANGETGFDPTDSDSDPLLRADYKRAIGACLEARDYVVR